ncbi:uncharacterized protein M437DRAFT_76678 [Aureobasidium melanogenum CBS 110374]|uniref:Uncharacterized protein n=1 Tax=Aureobasidium melanogenum (strain CBS 110374) TaxID=1043003 RepID=A0A074VPR3_AURM1|nr:uncharacterized protein M437DRAFT_76678 [Aureobasidium melanogenum CBS 110374]KEQ61104.1 hypothetical protein M437DRAFT_76678 [Aureobasidium melanogenum CBS 110374]
MPTSYPSYESLLTADTSPHASPDLLRLQWNLTSDNYAREWIEVHGLHADSDDFDKDCEPPGFDSEGVVERCCGKDRPGKGPRLEVVAEAGHFVTVRQFVSLVHPWLRKLKGQLRGAASVWAGWGPQEDPEMIVSLHAMPISVDDTRGWTAEWAAIERETQVNMIGNVIRTIKHLGL